MEILALNDGNRPHFVHASIEVSAKLAIDSPELPCLFPQGVRVYIPDIGIDDTATLVAAAKRITEIGYKAVPHIAVRRLTTRAALEERIKASVTEADVRDVLVIGGDVKQPQGEFASTLDLLETGFLDRYGITQFGVAGHPEGSRDFSEKVAVQVLLSKQAFAERTGAKARIVTQFGFDTDRFISWADGLREYGIDLPVHLGVAGPAKITTLLKYAALCGVGNSIQFLKKRSASLAALAISQSPEGFVGPVERHVREHPGSPIEQIHVFPFGGIKNTAKWLEERGTWKRDDMTALSSSA